jgi:hypothetical protein
VTIAKNLNDVISLSNPGNLSVPNKITTNKPLALSLKPQINMSAIESLIQKYVSRCVYVNQQCLQELVKDCKVISFKIYPVFIPTTEKIEKQFVLGSRMISIVVDSGIMMVVFCDPEFKFAGEFKTAQFKGTYHQLKEQNLTQYFEIISETRNQ